MGIVEARPPGADEFPRRAAATALAERAATGGEFLLVEADLATALAGEADDGGLRRRAQEGLERARRAYDERSCERARPTAEAAALDFLRAGEPAMVRDDLAAALEIVFSCADAAGDRAAARGAADRLRALGLDPPPGIPAAAWARYPALDAGVNVIPVEVELSVEPAGARVWVDLRELGTSPAKTSLSPGPHWISAVAPGHRPGAMVFEVPDRATYAVAFLTLVVPPSDRWSSLRHKIVRFRATGKVPTAAELGAIMEAADLAAVVLVTAVADGTPTYQVWRAGSPGRPAVPAGRFAAAGPTLAEAVALAIAAPPTLPLPPVRERPATHSGPREARRPWWVYGAAAAAVVLGAGAIYLLESGEDTQRIEVRWP